MASSQLILDRYRVIGQAGAGGYGTVQHAFDTHLKRDVAIKCITLSEDEVARARLVALEARMAAALEDEQDGAAGSTASGAAVSASESSPASASAAPGDFPADPLFLQVRDARRATRARSTATSDEVPPWEDEAAWQEYLAPWGASTENFQEPPRSQRSATPTSEELPYEASVIVEDAPWEGTAADARSVRVDHLQGIRASRTIDPADELDPDDVFEHIPGLQEARSVAHLNDANIVTVYDFAMEGSTAYVIMEYIEGKTLAQIIDEIDDGITLDMVASVFSSVAHALEAAHGESMLHLDIKPENVIVNSKGVVKVTDFGLAALMDASGSGTTGGGTIGYMPLEQMRQEPLDVRTDEWGLASLTYEMLTGSNPFFAPDLDAAEEAIEDAELVLPSLCWDELAEEADDIMFTALDPEKDERYESVAAFSEALLPLLGSTRKGKKALADIVNGVGEDEEEEAPAPACEPGTPLADRLGPRGASWIGRGVAAIAVGLLTALGLANLHGFGGEPLGLLGNAPLVFWVVVALGAALAAFRPSWGLLFGYAAFVVGLAASQAWLLALVTVLIVGGWWYLMGRRGMAPSVVVLLQPLFGSFGFAAVAPVTAGVFLPVVASALCAAFAFALAVIMASCGSMDVMNWDALWCFSFGANPQAACVALLSQASTWALGLSWVGAAAVYSLCCVRGTKAFDVAGAVAAAVVLLFGVCAAAHLGNFGGSWLPAPAALLGALVPGVLGIVAAVMNIPDRARWAEEEWDFVGEAEPEA